MAASRRLDVAAKKSNGKKTKVKVSDLKPKKDTKGGRMAKML